MNATLHQQLLLRIATGTNNGPAKISLPKTSSQLKEKVLIVEDQFVEADYLRLMLTKHGYNVCTIARSVPQAEKIISDEAPDIVLLDIFLKGAETGIDLARKLQVGNLPFIYLSANSNEDILSAAKATHPYGFLVKPFREKDLLVTLEIARYRYEHGTEARMTRRETLRQNLKRTFAQLDSWDNGLAAVGKVLQPYIPFDLLSIESADVDSNTSVTGTLSRMGYDEYQTIPATQISSMSGAKQEEGTAFRKAMSGIHESQIFSGEAFESLLHSSAFLNKYSSKFNLSSFLHFPIRLAAGEGYKVSFFSRRSEAYQSDHVFYCNGIEEIVSQGIAGILGNQLNSLSGRESPAVAPIENKSEPLFNDIIGKSHYILNVLDHVSIVAPTETSVLILGESGTGKERIADYIHELSPRHAKPFIKVNCAALPPTLIESELFGHEKGSFTGAGEKRVGKFEQADGGTIFLDEIGELPIEFQAKLLRVLQEKYVERIGSKQPTKIDVRIIAATNRNLEKEVAEGRFRLDLYYRLNVFPIELCPLRERKEDIAELAAHFIKQYNRKTGKKILGITDKVHQKLLNYHWPGNIRELEHMMERSILLSKSNFIEDVAVNILPPTETRLVSIDGRIKSIQENERDHILTVLKKCNGKIWGPGAAAELLNIPPSTLKSKMKKLGIERKFEEIK